MDKFDEIYSWDQNTSTYIAFKEFYSSKRDTNFCIWNNKITKIWYDTRMKEIKPSKIR